MAESSVVEVAPARFSEITAPVAQIDEAARALDGHPALGDAVWLDLEMPRPDSAGFLAGTEGYAHVARNDNASPDDATPGQWALGLAVAPDGRGTKLRQTLVAAALHHVAAHGGGRVTLWVLGAGPDDDTSAPGQPGRPSLH